MILSGGKIDSADGKIDLAGEKIIVAGGKIDLPNGNIILAGEKIFFAGRKIDLEGGKNNFGRWENWFASKIFWKLGKFI